MGSGSLADLPNSLLIAPLKAGYCTGDLTNAHPNMIGALTQRGLQSLKNAPRMTRRLVSSFPYHKDGICAERLKKTPEHYLVSLGPRTDSGAERPRWKARAMLWGIGWVDGATAAKETNEL